LRGLPLDECDPVLRATGAASDLLGFIEKAQSGSQALTSVTCATSIAPPRKPPSQYIR
jgi:hypothetical protein